MDKLEIGQKLWRYASPNTLEFKVTGVRNYQDTEQYEVECQGCRHGKLCQVLIGRDDYGNLQTINMLNNEEDDDQRHWHCNGESTGYYHTTLDECRKERLIKAIADNKKKIEEQERQLANTKNNYNELKNALDVIEERGNG